MKYCVLILCVVLLNATITITPVEDDTPRPGQNKPQSPVILPAILPQQIENKVTQVQEPNTNIIQIQLEDKSISQNTISIDPFPQPIFHETDLIGNHLEPIFPTIVTSNLSSNSYYYPYNQNDRQKEHRGSKRQHGNKKGDRYHKEKFNQNRNQQSDIFRPHNNNFEEEIIFGIAFTTFLILVVAFGCCVFAVKCNKRRQQTRTLRQQQNMQYYQQQYTTQLYQRPQKVNSQIRYHEQQILKLNKILRDQQQRLLARQNQNPVYQQNFNYYPPVAHLQGQMRRVYNPLNDDSSIPIGRPLQRGEFVNERF